MPAARFPDVLYPRSGELAKASFQIPPSPNISNWPSQVSNRGTKISNIGVLSTFANIQGYRDAMGCRIMEGFRGKCSCRLASTLSKNNWSTFLCLYWGRASPPRTSPVCAGFGYRNTSALYPHLGTFHLSAATCSRYSDRTFQLARSCALEPHKRLRIPRADLEVLGQANRGATSSSIVRVRSLGLLATGRKIKR